MIIISMGVFVVRHVQLGSLRIIVLSRVLVYVYFQICFIMMESVLKNVRCQLSIGGLVIRIVSRSVLIHC